MSGQRRSSISALTLHDLTSERVLAFLKHLEQERGNSVHTRNQRRAALNTFFAYLAVRAPEMLAACQQVAAIPVKRTSLPDTHYLEREEVTASFRALPRDSRFALRDRTLLLFLDNTGARVQQVADLRVEHLELAPPAKVRLHGKGDKWRVCPLWDETVRHLQWLLAEQNKAANEPVFCARRSLALTRFGITRSSGATPLPGIPAAHSPDM